MDTNDAEYQILSDDKIVCSLFKENLSESDNLTEV
jgi:hypothetical protein